MRRDLFEIPRTDEGASLGSRHLFEILA